MLHGGTRTFSREVLLELTGRRSYGRGADYASEVTGLTVDGDTVRGTVTGSLPYRAGPTPRADGMSRRCDRPRAEEGGFFKHAVALGPVHLFNTEHGAETSAAADIRAYLESLGHGGLGDLVLKPAASSPGVRDRPELRAAAGAGGGVDRVALRALIDRAPHVNGFVEYGQDRGTHRPHSRPGTRHGARGRVA